MICNIELFKNHKLVECGKPAIWKHPRYPDGKFCQEHKESVEKFFSKDWSLIEK